MAFFGNLLTGLQAASDRFNISENELIHGSYLNERYGLGQSVQEMERDGIVTNPVLDSSGRAVSTPCRPFQSVQKPTPESIYYYDTPSAQKINYQDAPLAELYGMDATTAYQEALANTSVQRRIRDLQSAGINPVLSVRGSGADGVSGASLAASSGGSSASGVSSSSGGSSALRDVLKTIRDVANTAASIGRLFR